MKRRVSACEALTLATKSRNTALTPSAKQRINLEHYKNLIRNILWTLSVIPLNQLDLGWCRPQYGDTAEAVYAYAFVQRIEEGDG